MPEGTGFAAAALLLTGAGIAWWQQRAATCSRHRRWAGRAAWGLAGPCVAGAVALLAVCR